MKIARIAPVLLAGLPLIASPLPTKTANLDWGVNGPDFPKTLAVWEKGKKWSEDDNFFISRVKPKARFRNIATQIDTTLDESIDKKLIYWVPINSKKTNALPSGVFDSEVFPFWSYVTHYGNWTAPLARVPGAFADVAHKNGVAVSAVASVPYGMITDEWRESLDSLSHISPDKLADYLLYYGIDGIGYNSEFKGSANMVCALGKLHEFTTEKMKKAGNQAAEFIWYDGTNVCGDITFDWGLSLHNAPLWGRPERPRTALFFNYNWNYDDLLENSVTNAAVYGRTPLDLYCSINMQGREPHNDSPEIWSLLAKYPLSIGLWGAHEESMFFESRAEKGSSPEERQDTYMKRVERWFSGGNRNPVNTPTITEEISYDADNTGFFGMASMMSARSPLKWNLSDEPFITYFNLGNGKFLNYQGERQHDREWYNIGVQDYLPTWMWWFSKKFLGRDKEDVPSDGLDAGFVWDDAWNGGSTVAITGNTDEEFLHLFKTEFGLEKGDVITFRYKVNSGDGDAYLSLSMKGNEETPVEEEKLKIIEKGSTKPGEWTERKFEVGKDLKIKKGDELAMVALHFKDAKDLDMRLGEFSIVRKKDTSRRPDTPIVEKSSLMSAHHGGADGKIVFSMPNDKGEDVCYNTDVNTSMFKLYAQQEGKEPVLMGMTTSWAGLIFDAPCTNPEEARMRFGVSALSLDHSNESETAWGEYEHVKDVYELDDQITVSKANLSTGEPFKIGYYDPMHEPADWTITDVKGNKILASNTSNSIDALNGILHPGRYNVIVKGFRENDGERVLTTDTLKGRLLVLDNSVAMGSRGIKVGRAGFGFKTSESGLTPDSSFTLSFRFLPETFDNKAVEMVNIRSKRDPWAKNQWGWFWHTLDEDGGTSAFSMRLKNGETVSYDLGETKMYPGVWNDLTYVFEINDKGEVLPSLYLNGERQRVTSWKLGENEMNGFPEFVGPVDEWTENHVISIGGYLHRSGSARGVIDDVRIWNKALSEAEITEMENMTDPADCDSLIGYFDFETEADENGMTENKGKGTFKAGLHDYRDSSIEGQGLLQWKKPEYEDN